jgi:phosphoribosylaminoimidazole-succinocarboxamide synthase
MSLFWFEKFTWAPNHLICADASQFPAALKPYEKDLQGRSMIVKKAKTIPLECIVRGYITGSGWSSYKKDGTVCGMKLRDGYRQAEKLDQPLFTPSTKAEEGHDINISPEEAAKIVGEEKAKRVAELAIRLYSEAADYAETKGIILADTKFEFGKIDGVLTVCDEMFTPDSSRFWDAAEYEPGHAQKSFDKQFLREWLETLDWDKTYPAPHLPQEIIDKTAEKYRECYSRITGKEI